LGKGSQKLGHPVPLSNFLAEENKGASHPAQRKVPWRFSSFNKLEKGGSVPSSLKTLNACGERRLRQSTSLKDHESSPAFEAAKTLLDLEKSPKIAVNKLIEKLRRLKNTKGPLKKTNKLD